MACLSTRRQLLARRLAAHFASMRPEMTARAAGMFSGGFVGALLIGYFYGQAAAFFYCAGLIIGPSLYLSRVPWKL